MIYHIFPSQQKDLLSKLVANANLIEMIFQRGREEGVSHTADCSGALDARSQPNTHQTLTKQ